MARICFRADSVTFVLSHTSHSTVPGADRGSWCLHLRQEIMLMRGIVRSIDESASCSCCETRGVLLYALKSYLAVSEFFLLCSVFSTVLFRTVSISRFFGDSQFLKRHARLGKTKKGGVLCYQPSISSVSACHYCSSYVSTLSRPPVFPFLLTHSKGVPLGLPPWVRLRRHRKNVASRRRGRV